MQVDVIGTVLQALDQVVLDFLTGITSRPDRKINKVVPLSVHDINF
jgi:hypothetical protein